MKKYFLFYVIVVTTACDVTELQDPTVVVESKDIISLEVVDHNFNAIKENPILLADSGSLCYLKAVLQSKTDHAEEIVFSTTSGVLTNVGVVPTTESQKTLTITPAYREVIIQLNALDVVNGKVVVSATSGKVSDVVEVIFGTSYPYDFQVNPLSSSIPKTAEIEITIKALVKQGCMSENQYLKVSATADSGIILDHPQFVKISNQKASFKIVNLSQTTGKATVIVELDTTAGKGLKKEVSLVYK